MFSYSLFSDSNMIYCFSDYYHCNNVNVLESERLHSDSNNDGVMITVVRDLLYALSYR